MLCQLCQVYIMDVENLYKALYENSQYIHFEILFAFNI